MTRECVHEPQAALGVVRGSVDRAAPVSRRRRGAGLRSPGAVGIVWSGVIPALTAHEEEPPH